jgi:hypothetical protein
MIGQDLQFTRRHILDKQVNQRYKRKFDIVRNLIRTSLLLAVVLLATASSSQAQVSVGIRIGPPPHPRVVRVLPPSPGPEFAWIDGYWYPAGHHYRWHDGYWTRPPYAGARWVGPHHDGEQFYAGYWEGDRGRLEHDHRWDHDHDRDQDRYHDQDQNHDQDGHHDDDHR